MEAAKAHSAALFQKDERIESLQTQVTSGAPSEQQMFSIAREQVRPLISRHPQSLAALFALFPAKWPPSQPFSLGNPHPP